MSFKKSIRRVVSAALCLCFPVLAAACGDPDPVSEIRLLAPAGEVCSYADDAERYLKAKDPNVGDYFNPELLNADKPVTVEWECDGKDVTGYRVEYATEQDYSDAIAIETEAGVFKTDLYNLRKGTKYFIRVTAVRETGESAVAESTFHTTALGPRVMKIEGVYNARDLGGYTAENGKTTLQ